MNPTRTAAMVLILFALSFSASVPTFADGSSPNEEVTPADIDPAIKTPGNPATPIPTAELPERDPKAIIDAQGLAQVTDTGAIEEEVSRILDASPSQVAQYKDGKTNVIGYFVGQVMKATKGAANPKAVNEILRRLLDEQ